MIIKGKRLDSQIIYRKSQKFKNVKELVNDVDAFFCYFLNILLYLAMHFLGLMVELYRRASRHITSICNASVTRFITGRLLT